MLAPAAASEARPRRQRAGRFRQMPPPTLRRLLLPRRRAASPRAGAAIALVVAVLFAVSTAPAGAQSRRGGADRASPLLSAQHWSLRAVRRVVALGLIEREAGWDDGSLSRRAVAEILRAAATLAPARVPHAAALTRGYWERFREEFPSTAEELDAATVRRAGPAADGAIALGLGATRDVALVGTANMVVHGGGGPVTRAPSAGVALTGQLGGRVAPHVAAEVAVARSADHTGWRGSQAHLTASLRSASVWGGRRAPRYGPAVGGGVLLNGIAPLTGGGLIVEPVRLPWMLRGLGPVRFETSLFALDSSGPVRRPWLTASHVSFSPHPRLLFGLTHSAMFGGEGQPPFTLENFTAMFLYGRTLRITDGREFENQIVSGEIRYRPPTGRMPLDMYLEWGSEDNRSAWWDSPGLVIGTSLAALPRMPGVALGIEHAYFGKPCNPCGHDTEYLGTEWYRHYIFRGGWAQENVPLGHPLGGHGREVLLYANVDAPDARLRTQTRALFRTRGRYNLFSPERAGRESGGSALAAWRVSPRLELAGELAYLRGLRERGAWNQLDARASLRYLF
jgi:hypothetical protein